MKKLNKSLIALTAATVFTTLPVIANADNNMAANHSAAVSKATNGCKSMNGCCSNFKQHHGKYKQHKKEDHNPHDKSSI